MLKKMKNLKGVSELKKSDLKAINGGANYYCWNSSGGTFNSSSDVSSSTVNCSPIAEVQEPDDYFYPSDGLRY